MGKKGLDFADQCRGQMKYVSIEMGKTQRKLPKRRGGDLRYA